MKIKDWLPQFLSRHQGRHPRHDWPEPESSEGRNLWRSWLDAFIRQEPAVREAEADLASCALDGMRCQFAQDHLPGILAAIQANRARAEQSQGAVADRDEAMAASKDCEICGGHGQPYVFRKLDIVSCEGVLKVGSHCVCPMGRWIRSHSDPEIKRRTPDVHDILRGVSTWALVDPEAVNMPEPENWRAADWKTLATNLAERMKVK